MRSGTMVLLATIVWTAGARQAVPDDRPAGHWRSDFAEAAAEARRLGRPLLVHFHAEWCLPCRRMEREVLHAPELQRKLSAGFVAVKVDSDRHPELVQRFEVGSLPCDLVVDPEGNVLVQTAGYQDLPAYLARMSRIEARFAQAGRLSAERPPAAGVPRPTADDWPPPAARRDDDVPADDPAPPVRAVPVAGRRPLGLDGFSPVTLQGRREWKPGRPEFSAEYKGVVYLLASAEEFDRFNEEPQRYAPQLLGCDPVVLSETDRAVPGSTQFGAYFGGALYLFVSQATRQRFRQDPERFLQPRHVVRVNQLERPGRQ